MKFQNLAKGFLGAALGLTLAFGMVTPAFAADINIGNAVEGQTYSAYKLFDVTTSTSGDKTNYSYTLDASETALKTLLEKAGLTFTASGDGSVYMVTDGLDDETDAASLAKYLKQNIDQLGDADGTAPGSESGSATITDLEEGYYFVDTTTGTMCILNTTGATDIVEKNETPTVEKKVTNDDKDSAQVGDTVNFEITINAKPGAENYVLHDDMSDGLTLTQDSIVVKAGETTLTSPADYSIAYPTGEGTDGCDFEITFTKTYLDSITTDTTITVTYSAVLNENAVTGTDPETNKAILNYGENNDVTTTPAETKTYTYDFDLTKTDENEQPLTGAEFSLYSQEEGGTAINLVDLGNGNYRVATSTDQNTTTTIVVNSEGKATVDGLAGKNYWLEETKAPNGYNMLTERKVVTFNDTNTPATDDFAAVTVENHAGTELPSTGGMGTTALYAVGAALVIGAGVTLVVRRRASHEA
ncbi:SpaH/EbpB family LPXTG-anchored major pilin [Olsenella profusa]|uniref:SpaH/EbpB family LPXTG-anchored major pilin n=1 Tax=Olsenella profusa TaxID=138595 RepID=A0ABS2F2L3_9ACTN|nr:SpaH/EbpB family LPXTG-anchored major pilin [Olsenella profusa]MBM6775229.1 SpaH/EbpB family LPXTG-anchored major pilin [Olsenella profusa]